MTAREGHSRVMDNERALRAWRVRVSGGTWEQARAAGGYFDVPTVIRACREMAGVLPEPDRSEDRALLVERVDELWLRVRSSFAEARTPSQVATLARAGVAVARLRGQLTGVVLEERPVTPAGAELDAWVAAMLTREGSGAASEFAALEADVIVVEGEAVPEQVALPSGVLPDEPDVIV